MAVVRMNHLTVDRLVFWTCSKMDTDNYMTKWTYCYRRLHVVGRTVSYEGPTIFVVSRGVRQGFGQHHG